MTQIEINDNLLRRATRSMTAKITTTGDVDENRRVTRSMRNRLQQSRTATTVEEGNNPKR